MEDGRGGSGGFMLHCLTMLVPLILILSSLLSCALAKGNAVPSTAVQFSSGTTGNIVCEFHWTRLCSRLRGGVESKNSRGE